MPKSNFTQRKDFYSRLFAEDYNKAKSSSEYKNVLDALHQLSLCTDQIEAPDNPEGRMTPDSYQELCSAYEQVVVACGEFFTKNMKHTSFEISRINLVKELGTVASRDLKMINGLNKENPGTLKNAVKEARISKLRFSTENLPKTGGVQSTRIPIKKTNGQKGYFTAATTYNLDQMWTEAVTKQIKNIPKQYREIFEKLKTDITLQTAFVRSLPKTLHDVKFTKNSTSFALATPLSDMGFGSFEEVQEMLDNNEKMGQAVLDIAHGILDHKITIGFMESAGINKNARIDLRNCAMSNMAKLLCHSELLAEAKPMEIYIDGKAVDGVFMENAEGVDINNLNADNDIKTTPENFFNSHALSQLADLQVLDYICGNVDRHNGNIIFQFEKLPDGTQRVQSIKGIDNDCSFGTIQLNKEERVFLKMAGPAGIGYINKEMADKLANMNIDVLKLVLANDGLSHDEIKAASDRMEMVKELIAEKKIQIMDKTDWDKANLSEIAKNSEYFYRMQNMAKNFGYNKKKSGMDTQREFAVSNAFNATNLLSDNYSELQKLKGSMSKANVAYLIDSSEFKAMKNSLNSVLELAGQCKVTYLDNHLELSEADSQKLMAAIKTLKENTDTYIMAKGLSPSTDHGKQRLQVAKDLRDFANEYLENLEITPKEKAREVDEPEAEIQF